MPPRSRNQDASRWRVGVVGHTGSGKSTACGFLAECGAVVLNADELAHEVYLPGTPTYDAILSQWGETVRRSDGTVNRRELAKIVFADDQQRGLLEALVWPPLRARLLRETAMVPAGVIVLDAAVLVRAGWVDLVDEVWTIERGPDASVRHAACRDGIEIADVQQRLAAQERHNTAQPIQVSQVISNDGSVDDLRAAIVRCWEGLPRQALALARSQAKSRTTTRSGQIPPSSRRLEVSRPQ